jgi:predicted transcriptional regulator
MSKAVMISIRPGWCEKIAGGEKTIEVRKTRPKLETPFKCYIYCTVGMAGYEELWVLDAPSREKYLITAVCAYLQRAEGASKGNRKVIAEFTCDRIYELETRSPGGSYYVKGEDQPTTNDVARQSCLTLKDMHEYLQSKVGYGWHISNLKIYDTPKELSKFPRPFENCIDKVCDEFGCASCENGGHIKRPPQSWCYVEEVE